MVGTDDLKFVQAFPCNVVSDRDGVEGLRSLFYDRWKAEQRARTRSRKSSSRTNSGP